MFERRRAQLSEETGAVAVVTALLLTVLLLFSALAIDLGALRADRASGQLVADMAATAAVADYDADVPGAARDACEQALAYASENLGVTLQVDPDGPGGCSLFPSGQVCADDTAPITAQYTADRIRVSITSPVPDGPNEPTGLMQQASYTTDGAPCDRVGVRVDRERDFLLAPAGGSERTTGSTSRSAVAALLIDDDPTEFASLVVLQRNGCATLLARGKANLFVGELEQAGDVFPGTITVDTEPDGCNNDKVIDPGGSASIVADGKIISQGLAGSDPTNLYVYDPDDVGLSLADPSNLFPRPVPGSEVTRALVDHRFNCLDDYSGTEGSPWSPVWSSLSADASQPIDGCEEAIPPFVQELHGWLAVGTSAPADASGETWYDAVAEGDDICNKNAGPITISGEPLVYIDCPGDFEPDDVTITGATHVVVNGDIEMGNQEALTITGDLPSGTALVLRDGDFDRTGGDLRLRRVFTYAAAGRLNLRGTSGDILWKALPRRDLAFGENPSACREGGRPTAACFGPLAFWGNSTGDHFIRGAASGGVIGTFFIPNGLLELRGGEEITQAPCDGGVTWSTLASSTGSLNLEGAQFFANRYDIAGDSGLRLCPSPDTTLPTTPDPRVTLLR